MFDIIVIGGGPAGVTAALRARELGASVALVERGDLGGTCTNDGCAPTRVLAKAARLSRDTRQHALYGFEGNRPTLNWEHLLARTQAVVHTLHEKKQLLYHLHESGVEVFLHAGDARFTSAHAIELADGTTLSGEKFILCVGGRARRLTFPGAEHALTHSDIWTLKQLPTSVVILGAAATGCQLGSILNEFGLDITLLERSPRIVPIEDEATSAVLHQEFTERGIRIVTNLEDVTSIEKNGQELTLFFKRNGTNESINTGAVIMAIGWPGNIETLNLEAAGINTARGYIAVDDQLRTSAPHIWAAGDITGRMMLVQSASIEGRIAAENAVRSTDHHVPPHQLVPHGGFTNPEYGSVGLTEAQAEAQHDCAVAVVNYAELDRAVIDDHTVGFCKLIVSRSTLRVLGAHVVGEQAVEVTQLVAAGMAAGIRIEQLAQMELAYPTYAAIVGLTARRLVSELGLQTVGAEWRMLGKTHGVEWERKTS